MRNASLNNASWSVLLLKIALVIFCVILVPLSLLTFKQAVRWAKIDGSGGSLAWLPHLPRARR